MRFMLSIPLFVLATVATMAKCHPTDESAKRPAPIPLSSERFWFSQPIDHFGLNDNTWSQQYLFNATYYKPGGPIIIVTPGESNIKPYYTDGSYFNQVAKETNGLVVAVEHRFYGDSNPMPDLSGASLKYHTIDNVLEDFAQFTRAVKYNPSSVFPFSVKPNSKVIFGGGSYAGSLAAWMRAKYPNIVNGAWASSAIIQYSLENYHLDQSWGKHLVALGCGPEMQQAVKELDTILLSSNQTAIDDMQARFGTPKLTPRDFAGLITSLISADGMTPSYEGIDYTEYSVCEYFDGKSSNLDSFARAVSDVIEKVGLSQEAMTQMADTTLGWDNYALGQVSRVWYYQSCAWYGNWQVAAPKSTGLSPYRSSLVDIQYFQPNCKNKFGSHMPDRPDSEGFHNKWFNILKGVSNIYYTVGALDIWRGNNVITWSSAALPNTYYSPTYLMNGATHSQDVAGPSTDDLESVKHARQVGLDLVKKWVR
ncbi:hypothetical protein GGI07_005159 [Coemansia sp. Benny D115]|nr:hypothetical protein GGI07_005159 [Coemansia sp. Benny D115]